MGFDPKNKLRKEGTNDLKKKHEVAHYDNQIIQEEDKISPNKTDFAHLKVAFDGQKNKLLANPALVKIDLNVTENMAKMIIDHNKN